MENKLKNQRQRTEYGQTVNTNNTNNNENNPNNNINTRENLIFQPGFDWTGFQASLNSFNNIQTTSSSDPVNPNIKNPAK